MQVKFKKLHPSAVLPSYSRKGDAAMDVSAISIVEETSEYIEYGTGLSYELPEGWVALAFPRSSLSKQDLTLSNSVGVLDSNYRGELRWRFRKTKGEQSKVYQIGNRIGQILILPHPIIEPIEVDELSETNRGQNGFGSSGV